MGDWNVNGREGTKVADPGQDRQVEVHMGSGFPCYATTRYCQPKNRSEKEEDHTPGLDIELSLFGFSGNVSPWLVSKVTLEF